MLASRAHNIQRLARSFATVVDATGVKVATVDTNQPTSSVTVLVRAGSRFESKQGVANALKNFAFKSTRKRSAIGTVRESELYGGVLSSSLGREHLFLTAEFLRQDAPFFVDVLSSFVTSAKFTRHEFEEFVTPLVDADTDAASHDSAIQAIELAHALAFRHGLGQSLFAPSHNSLTVNDVQSFAASSFAKNNIAILGTGIDQDSLSSLVNSAFSNVLSSSTVSSSPSKYFGGETRLQSPTGPQTIFIGHGSIGPPSVEIAALAAYLSPNPSVKWSKGLTPLSSLPEGASVQTVYLPYSDATLFGFLVQGSTAAAAKEASKVAVAALKNVAHGIKAEELKTAIAKAKFTAANAFENREGLVNAIASRIFSGSEAPLSDTLLSLDKISATAFSKSAASLISTKPTYVVIGQSQALPYVDELGL